MLMADRHRHLHARHAMRRIGALAWILALGCIVASARAQTPWLVTLTDGSASVIEGARRVEAAVGYKAAAGAIVETAPEALLLRLESSDEVSIDLGPATQVMVDPPDMRRRDGPRPRLYLLQGWVKVSRHGAAPAPAVRTPLLNSGTAEGVVVIQVVDVDAAGEMRADCRVQRTGPGDVPLARGTVFPAREDHQIVRRVAVAVRRLRRADSQACG